MAKKNLETKETPFDMAYLKEHPYYCVQDDNYAWLPDSTVDLVLCDPPFNIAQDTNFHTYEKNTVHSFRFDKDKGWDTYSQEAFIKLMEEWAVEIDRVLRTGGSFAIFCADKYISHLMDALTKAGLKVRRVITWRKSNAVPVNRDTLMMSACEYIVMGVKDSKAVFNSDVYLKETIDLSVIEQFLVADKTAAVIENLVRKAVEGIAGSVNDETHIDAVASAVESAILKGSAEAVKRVRAMYVADDKGKNI
jgi:hypothetical protein